MDTATRKPARRWASVQRGSDYLQQSLRTTRTQIAQGIIPAYRIPGTRLIRLDLNELDELLKPIPNAKG